MSWLSFCRVNITYTASPKMEDALDLDFGRNAGYGFRVRIHVKRGVSY